MDNLKSLNELQKMEGLDRQVHQTLEGIVRSIKDGGVCISLEQAGIDVE